MMCYVGMVKSAKLPPMMFICLLEEFGNFLNLKQLGKLQNQVYEYFLDNVIRTICDERKFSVNLLFPVRTE
jgi:hypothetical protein